MTQGRALDILKTGANVFLTGEPGAGKTYVINQYIAWLEAAGLSVAVTASTGIAATHIGGMTIHAWSGIGIRDRLTPHDLDAIASKEKIVRRAKTAHVLVIDEISMLDGSVLDMVDQVLRTIRQSGEAFGGVQVVFIGDFFQLPPVARQGDMLRYAFESNAWQRAQLLTCYLTEQHRQEDELFLSLLSSIRRNEIEEDHYTLLSEQTEIAYTNVEPTRLYTHNADVDAVNLAQLQSLPGKPVQYTMQSRGAKPVVEGMMKSCLSPQLLTLKEEAMVMCTKNNFEAGYVNGTLGRVVRFAGGHPVIATADGRELTIEPVSWELAEDGKLVASLTQLPLRLAWAITVHKSQGMSLDAAEIDLSRAFVYGQGYVALSRVRSLAGMKVIGMHPNALQVDPKVVAQDAHFHQASVDAEAAFAALEADEVAAMHAQFVVRHGGVVPVGEVSAARSSGAVRLEKESTTQQTLALLAAGKTVAEVAAARDMAESTIVGHIETLAHDGAVDAKTVERLLVAACDWPPVRDAAFAALEEHGIEKLKPLYEALDGALEYNHWRLARALFVLGR